MGNPFGKIIQSGVEYDVTPYAHKVQTNFSLYGTWDDAISSLYNALHAKVSDFTTIKNARIIIKKGNSYEEYRCRNKGVNTISFIGCHVAASSGYIREMTIATGGSHFDLSWNSQGTASYSKLTSPYSDGTLILEYT